MMELLTGAKGGGKGGGGGSGRVAQEAPNTLQSKAVLRSVEFLTEGEFGGLVNGAQSIFLDDTPLQNADGTFNFEGVNWHVRNGTPDQEHIAGFRDVQAEVSVGTQVEQATPVVRTITDANTDAVAVTIRLPQLTDQDRENGDLNGSTVAFRIDYQPYGGSYIEAVSEEQGTITGKTTSTYEKQFRFDLTGEAPWNIRVTRITPDSDDASLLNDLFFASYTRIIDHKLIYPDTALVALEIDSSLFGSNVPQRAFEFYGVKLRVPTNYDPVTRVYTGVWDGTFKTAWSDNPAWVVYDALTRDRYGLGDYIDADEVDKYGLYTIAQYCDELVNDGKGGQEPRYTFNGIIETQEEALKVIQAIVSNFRGMTYWGAEGSAGVVTAVHDAPKDPIKIFSNANVIEGIFDYSSSADTARHSICYVTWNNPDDNYAANLEVVESRAILDFARPRPTEIVAFGCTSRGQARRAGAWVLDSELNADQAVNFGIGLADADLRPGDIIKIFDADFAEVRYGGRIRSGTVTSITLDDAVTLEGGETYTLDVVLPDGTLEASTIVEGAGTYTTVTLATPLSQTPEPLTMWAISATNLEPRLFRVISVREDTPIKFDVFAIEHDPGKYARVEENILLDTPNFTRLSTGPIDAPSGLNYTEYQVSTGSVLSSNVDVSWVASPDPRTVRYELEVRRPGGTNTYELARVTNGLTHTITDTIDGTWSFRVRAVDALNNYSQWHYLEDQTFQINSRVPDDVTGLQITNLAGTSVLTWTPVTSTNLSHYEIRYTSDLLTPTWNASIVVVERVSKDTTSQVVASRTGSFMIKAVSLPTGAFPQGVYSDNEVFVSTDIDFLTNFNFLLEEEEDPLFAGSRSNVTVRGGNLELEEASPGAFEAEGIYEHQNVVDLSNVYTCRVTPNIVVAGNLVTNNVEGWENVDTITNVDGATDGLWRVEVQVSATKDDPNGTPTWTEYKALDVGDINARAFRFRTILTSNSDVVTPSVETLSVTIDMPDIIQSEEDIASLSSGILTVNFPETFNTNRPALVITPQNMQTGDYYSVTNQTASGFDIEFKDSSNARVVRTFDYHVKGGGILGS